VSGAQVIALGAPATSEAWLTKAQLAERLDVSIRWIDYRRCEGMPSHKWGGVVRFRLSEVEAWLSERRAA
jgi:phage terminase Nu1 subunit (DNA packaging protein)